MKRYVAFLRGINVSGHNLVKMDTLKQVFAMLGFNNITTYIQSGNVLFDARDDDNATLQYTIEQQLVKELGFPVKTIVRSLEEVAAIINETPFAHLPANDARKLYITLLDTTPLPDKVAALQDLCTGSDEQMIIAGTSLYFITAAYGNTRFSNTFVEKKLGVNATTRNWATMNKVVTL